MIKQEITQVRSSKALFLPEFAYPFTERQAPMPHTHHLCTQHHARDAQRVVSFDTEQECAALVPVTETPQRSHGPYGEVDLSRGIPAQHEQKGRLLGI